MEVLHHRVVRRDIHWFGFQKRNHVITLCSFSSFKPRLAPEQMGGNAHTHQRTQLTIVTNIIDREFVARAMLSYVILYSSQYISEVSVTRCSVSWGVLVDLVKGEAILN